MRVGVAFLSACVLVVPATGSEIRHRWVCVDNGANRLIHVDQSGASKNWSVAVPAGSRDLQSIGAGTSGPLSRSSDLRGGKLLVSHGNGAAEYDLADGRRLQWVVDRYRSIQTARRLPDGNTLLCTRSGVLYEVDRTGREVRTCQIEVKKLNMRLMRVLRNGNLLIGSAAPRAAIEVTRRGKVVRTMRLPNKGYTAIRLEDGKTMAGTGGEARIVTLDVGGRIVSHVGGKDAHPELGLDFCSGWDRLPNGNCVMANWLGHRKRGTAPHLVEFSPDNKVVWTWGDHKMARQVTNVLMIPITSSAIPVGAAPAEKAPILVRAKNFVVTPSTGPVTGVVIRNRLSRPYRGTLKARFPEGWQVTPGEHAVELRAGETKEYAYAIERGSDLAANSYAVEITVEGNGQRTVSRQQVVCASAPYFKPVIDGKLTEWKDSIPISFTTNGKKTVTMLYWNKRRFCLAVEVEEDTLVDHIDNSSRSGIDAVQFALSTSKARTGTRDTDKSARFEFLVTGSGAGRAGGRCFLLMKPGDDLALARRHRGLDALLLEDAEVAVERSGGVTRYEVSVPFRPMRALRPTPGREFCFSLLVHDPDGTGVRDLGEVMNLWESQRNPLAWCSWRNVRWGKTRPFDGKIEFGFCSSIH